jgi:hypothetical protein
MFLGYAEISSAFKGVVDVVAAGAGAALSLNPSGGNVGIGTTAPIKKLDVVKDSTFNTEATFGFGVRSEDVANYDTGIWFGADAANNIGFIQSQSGGSFSNRALSLQPNGGSVGIGTAASTDSTLHVIVPTNIGGMRIGFNGTSANYFDGDNQFFRSGNGGTTRMTIDSSGNVGVGGVVTAGSLVANGTVSTTSSGTLSLRQGKITTTPSNATDAFIGVQDTGGPGALAGDLLLIPRSSTGVPCAVRMFAGETTPLERLTILSDGNVLIDTTTPVQRLTIGSTLSTSSGINLRTTQTDFSIIPSNSAGGGVTIATSWVSGGQGPLIFTNSSGETMRIASNGNVGIGTTSPQAKLVVSKAGAEGLEITPGDSAGLTRFLAYNRTDSTYDDLALRGLTIRLERASGDASMYLDTSGNVGIGTTSPGVLLDVSTSAAADTDVFIVRNTSASASAFTSVKLVSSGTARGLLRTSTQSGAFDIGNPTAFDLNLFTNGVANPRLTINSSGSVGIGTTGPDGAALLDLTSTTKGFLPPRMTTTQRDAIPSPPLGLIIYNSTAGVVQAFVSGSVWANL